MLTTVVGINSDVFNSIFEVNNISNKKKIFLLPGEGFDFLSGSFKCVAVVVDDFSNLQTGVHAGHRYFIGAAIQDFSFELNFMTHFKIFIREKKMNFKTLVFYICLQAE
jgi:hypothetical protein